MFDHILRTALFVPASRPERIPKALACQADRVIVDLEDAVQADAKATARQHIAAFAANHPASQILVRINDATTPWFEEDLALCRTLPSIIGIVLPKAETGQQIQQAAATGKRVMPIIESARGADNLAEICREKSVSRIAFGNLDFSLDLGLDTGSSGAAIVLDHVRCQLVLQSRLAGIAAPLYGVWPDIKDETGLTHTAQLAKGMGFSGLLCIHPLQVVTVNAVFSATPKEIEWAERVLKIVQETGTAVFKLDGEMVDMPVIERARRIVQQRQP